MTLSDDEQTISLDALPELPLDQFPDALQRVSFAKVGLDGLTDAMTRDLQPDPFVAQSRDDGIWRKLT